MGKLCVFVLFYVVACVVVTAVLFCCVVRGASLIAVRVANERRASRTL